ncbi:MAG: hypothetical protein AAF085_06760 [Planctomycetota bacterium]
MQARTKKWIKRALIGSAAVLVLGAGLTVYLLQRPPVVWREAQVVLKQSSPQMREQITAGIKERLAKLVQTPSAEYRRLDLYGESVRTDIIDEQHPEAEKLSEVPLDEFAKLTLTNTELVAMVNEFFVQWTEQRGYIVPGGINDPSVIARNGKLYLAFMIDTPHWQQVFSGEVQLTFREDGMAEGRVENLYAGSMPVSLLSVGELLRMKLPASEHDTADRLGEWLDNLERFEFRPVLELEHRRRARIVAMGVGDDGVTLKMRVQDHRTYRAHNDLLGRDQIAVTDLLDARLWDGSAIADVPTTTD